MITGLFLATSIGFGLYSAKFALNELINGDENIRKVKYNWKTYAEYLYENYIEERVMNFIYDKTEDIKVNPLKRLKFAKKYNGDKSIDLFDQVLNMYMSNFSPFEIKTNKVKACDYGYILECELPRLPVELSILDIIDTKEDLESIMECKVFIEQINYNKFKCHCVTNETENSSLLRNKINNCLLTKANQVIFL